MSQFRRRTPAWSQPPVAWDLLPAPQPELLTFPLPKTAQLQVKTGQSVKAGQKLAQTDAGIFCPVSGTVLEAGSEQVCVQNDFTGQALAAPPNPVLDELSPEQIFAAIENSGAAGPDGVPTARRLRGLSSPPDSIAVCCTDAGCNAMSQAFTLYHQGEKVLGGLRVLLRLLGTKDGLVLAPARQKPLLDKLQRLLPADNTVTMRTVPLRYPALSASDLLGKTALILSAQEAAAVYDSVYLSQPVLRRMMTLTTPDRTYAMDVLLGTPLSHVLTQAGLLESASAVLAGDGLTGGLVTDLQMPVTVALSQITIFTGPPKPSGTVCIHCGRCAAACPAGLRPDRVFLSRGRPASAAFLRRTAKACIQCGLCQYHCPARLPLLQLLQTIRRQDIQEVYQHG